MTRGSYIKALSRIIWGYIFIYININIGVIDILPNWLGYVFIISALDAIYELKPSVSSIKGPCILLGLWNGILWIYPLLESTASMNIVSMIMSIVELYFHFQLLTLLWEISTENGCCTNNRLKQLRNIWTILMTMFALPINWNKYIFLKYGVVVVILVVVIWICGVLLSYRNAKKSLLDV
jgi:hypothetical protein